MECLEGQDISVICAMSRTYHHHIVDIVDRLIGGVRAKGPHTAVNIADIAQVWPTPSSAPLYRFTSMQLNRRRPSWLLNYYVEVL